MTIIAIWHRKQHGDLYAIADSRLISPQGVVCEAAPKFAMLNIVCHILGKNKHDRCVLNGHIGVGYTGSATVALTTIATAQAYLASLTLELGQSTPTIKDIADFLAKVLKDNYQQFGALWGPAANCDLIVFGALPSDKRLSAFHINAVLSTEIEMEITELALVKEEKCYAFGSASSYFLDRLKSEADKTLNFLPFNLLRRILDEGVRKDIGGDIQVALASHGSVLLPHVITPRLDRGENDADVTFLGRNMVSIGNIGQCGLGRYAVGPDPTALLEMRKAAGFTGN